MKSSGKPRVLASKRKASVVVQDARSRKELLSTTEEAETTAILRRRLASVRSGTRGRALADVLEELGRDE
jgi:hypothetical protein